MKHHHRSLSRLFVALALLALSIEAAGAQVTRHPIIRPSRRNQLLTGVAVDGQGTITFSWWELFNGTLWYRRFDRFNHPAGPPVLLAGANKAPSPGAVAANPRGDWMVSWGQEQPESGETWTALYNHAAGGSFRIRRPGELPLLGLDDQGRFVVVWRQDEVEGRQIRAQRFDASGRTLGTEISVNAGVAGEEPRGMTVAMNPRSGEFVVAWESVDDAAQRVRLLGRRFVFGAAAGAVHELDAAALEDLSSIHPYFAPAVAWTNGDHFSLVWARRTPDGFPVSIWLQRFNGDFSSLRGKVLVTDSAPIPDGTPRIAGSPSGETLLVWDDNGTSDIYVRLYRGSSVPAGPEVDLVRPFSTYVGTGQIAFAPGDQVVIGWTNFVDTARNGWNISFDRIPASLLRHP